MPEQNNIPVIPKEANQVINNEFQAKLKKEYSKSKKKMDKMLKEFHELIDEINQGLKYINA